MSPRAPRTSQPRPASRWRRRLKRALLALLIGVPVLTLVLWIAVHRIPWLGPALADGLRRVIGTEAVSRLEDFVYGVEDRWNRVWREGEQPKAYWEVPSDRPQAHGASAGSGAGGSDPTAGQAGGASGGARPSGPPPRVPADVGPLFKTFAATGDGAWVPVVDSERSSAPALLYKTLLHPDRTRPWAELFVIAADLRHLELHLVAGQREPKAALPEARGVERPGVIPTDHHGPLLVAFNGGFKTEHGRWGMMLGGVTYVPGRKYGCTLVCYADEQHGQSLRIDPWQDVVDDGPSVRWWRQTPPCMVRQGKRHGGLWDPDAKGWGAALEGDTVIRRSAIGLNEARDMLYVSVSNHTNARAIADGMRHAGAFDVAQLDVNWSYPKIVLFPRGEYGLREPQSLFEGFKVEEGEYLREPSPRDFFYLVRRTP